MQKLDFNPKALTAGIVLVILALSALAWIGCDKESQPITAPTAESQQPGSLSKTGGDINAIMTIQNRHTDVLMAIRNVVGTATTQLPDGKYAVKILTKVAGMEGSLPKILEGMPVVVEEVGEIRMAAYTGRYRPVRPGVTVGNINECGAGTIGCIVRKNGREYILSNNHVLARRNAASIGEDVVQPGRFDVNCAVRTGDVVADLSEFRPITFVTRASNRIDAAIARMRSGVDNNCTTICGYMPSRTTVLPWIGMSVKKCGRTTGLTTGTVTGVNVTCTVDFDPGPAERPVRFVNQIQFTGMSAGGDSGSLIVTNTRFDHPVALLFADSPNATFGNPIREVLNYFGVTICGKQDPVQ